MLDLHFIGGIILCTLLGIFIGSFIAKCRNEDKSIEEHTRDTK